MNGLEQILLKIEEDTNLKISQIKENILSQGTANAEAITAEAKAKAEKIIFDAEAKAERIKASAHSGSTAASARKLAATKSEIVKDCITYVAKKLSDMPDSEYFAALTSLITKHAHSADGMLLLTEKDAERLPAGFIIDINSILSEKGGSLSLSDNRIKASGGCVLRYGGIDENCTFEALIADNIDKIKDALISELKEV